MPKVLGSAQVLAIWIFFPPHHGVASTTTIPNCLECQKSSRKGLKLPRKWSLATNCQTNSLKNRREGKLISLAVLELKDDFLEGWPPVDIGPIGFCIMTTSIRGPFQAHGQDRRTWFKMVWTSSCKDRPSWNIRRVRLCNWSRTP
jgi:hypothetical protein